MKKVIRLTALTVIMLILCCVAVSATTVEFFSKQLTIADNANTGKANGDTGYIVTAKGGLFSAKTNNITITNAGQTKAEIRFDYVADKANAFTIDGAAGGTSGGFTKQLEAGGTVKIVLTSNKGMSNTTATLTLSNIAYTSLLESSDITINYNSELGAVAAGGVAVADGGVVSVGSEGVELVATPVSGAKFVAWVNADGEVVSKSATYAKSPDNVSVTALFSKNTPYFMVGSYMLSDLHEACTKGNTVVLACDGTLPAGNYTIPAGVTLLIPFDDANTLCTDKPQYESAKTKPSVYRTLTMASGANITVNGAISISGKQSATIQYHGSVIGPYGHIAMKEGSSITLNSGSNLYAWGYITGSGSINALSGSYVYEDFQLRDYRGGDATTELADNTKEVFPMSQYYVQNIEVPLTLHAGAIEKGFMSLYVTLAGIQTTHVDFIGGDKGMFYVSTGSITKDYDESTDRLVIDVNGSLEMKSLTISMKISLIGSTTIDSSDFVLPVNGNITLNVRNGSTVEINQKIGLLPGGVINIEKGATCNVNKGAKVILYDKDQWQYTDDAGAVKGYCSQFNSTFMAANWAPGRKYTRTDAKDIVDAKVNIAGTVNAVDGFVYTTASGADACGIEGGIVYTKPGTQTSVYQVVQNNTEIAAYNEIPITPAKLKNEEGSAVEYVETASESGCNYGYIYKNGQWEAYHDLQYHDAQAATCDRVGWNAYETCSRCDYTTYEEIAALGHDKVSHDAQAATCEAIGWNAYETCSRCDYTTYEEIAATGHSYEDFVCSACGDKKIITNTEYTINGESIIINTSLTEEVADDTQIVIVIYDVNGKVLNISFTAASELKEVVLSSSGAAMIKVFAWSSFDSIKPVSFAEEIEL